MHIKTAMSKELNILVLFKFTIHARTHPRAHTQNRNTISLQTLSNCTAIYYKYILLSLLLLNPNSSWSQRSQEFCIPNTCLEAVKIPSWLNTYLYLQTIITKARKIIFLSSNKLTTNNWLAKCNLSSNNLLIKIITFPYFQKQASWFKPHLWITQKYTNNTTHDRHKLLAI